MVVSFLAPLLPLRPAMGSYGVSAFFVLSGFLLGRPYVDALLQRRPLPNWKRFARRRFYRIWPAYAAIVLLATGKALVRHGVHTVVFEDIAAHLLMIHNFFPSFVAGANNVALWTMAVDAQFYVALPIVAWFIFKRDARSNDGAILSTLAAIVVVSIGWRFVIPRYFPETAELVLVVQRNLVGLGSSFAVGVFVAYLDSRRISCSIRTARYILTIAVFLTIADFAIAAFVSEEALYKEFAMDMLATVAIGTTIFAIPKIAWRPLVIFLSARYSIDFCVAFGLCCLIAAPLLHTFIELSFLTAKERARELHVVPQSVA